ncbi:hypothetical protein BDB01DRAFT_731505 [Pilobolus umbonatus]|nr:hypothetical protein BDB01DRAFT_731505 [Pilobolus umbonatus]
MTSSRSDISSFCLCHDLITSSHCEDCGRPFTAIQSLQEDYDLVKHQVSRLRNQKTSYHHERYEYVKKENKLKKLLQAKEEGIEMAVYGIQSLEHDIETVKVKCTEERDKIEQIQLSKETTRRELEELSLRLFEEANKMVVIEQDQQRVLRTKNDMLETQLVLTHQSLESVQNELNLIRNQMETHQPIVDIHTRAQLDMLMIHGVDRVQIESVEDDAALMDFSEFIQTVLMTPLRKLHGLKYMRYCIREDIEPTLRFGPHPRVASKKIMDSILVKTCLIEECPKGYVHEQKKDELLVASLWDRFTQSNSFMGCQACGREVVEEEREDVLEYRFRVSYFDEWACIDSYCRDRLMTVIAFYAFIHQLRVGAYKHRSLHELYQECMRLKLQMFLARMGALPTVLTQCGLKSTEIATPFREEISNVLSDPFLERLSTSTESMLTVSTIASSRTSASST